MTLYKSCSRFRLTKTTTLNQQSVFFLGNRCVRPPAARVPPGASHVPMSHHLDVVQTARRDTFIS